MPKLTRIQIKDYLRSIVDEFGSDRINDNTLNEDINLAQRKIQLDTLEVGGVKQYTKSKISEGYIVSVPTDMLFHPNAIIDIQASTGTQGVGATIFVAVGNDTPVLTVRLNEVGKQGSWSIRITDNSINTEAILSSYSIANRVVDISLSNNVTLVSSLIALFETNVVLKNLFTASFNAGIHDVPIILTDSTQTLTIDEGTGSGWKYAEEKSIEKFNRVKGREFSDGTANEPIYRRLGDSSASQVVEFAPTTILFSKIYYHYLLADLTSDSDTSALPVELEELLLIDCQRRIYIYLQQQQNTAEQTGVIQQRLQDIAQKYQDALSVKKQDNQRIGAVEE